MIVLLKKKNIHNKNFNYKIIANYKTMWHFLFNINIHNTINNNNNNLTDSK